MSGPERFDRYVERCLYDPETGFYTSGVGVAGGRGGDFITSPEVGPLFGAVVARALAAWWLELDRPEPFVVVDAGAGPGSLLRAVELAQPPFLSVWEPRSVDLAGSHRSELGGLEGAVVLANELLDNMPFRVVERQNDGWYELHVAEGHELLRPFQGSPPAFALEVGERAPLLTGAGRWVADVLDQGVARLVAFDYGAHQTAELASRGGWLRTYRQHQRGDDPLREPGSWDITTDVGFDQLPPASQIETQADFLATWGIEELVEEGKRVWSEKAAAPDVAAIRMRSRSNEYAALTDPAGLGGWLVATWVG